MAKAGKALLMRYNARIILCMFGISGAAALIYQIVWSRWLQFIFGSTVQTVSTIFAAFLLGFSLGSYFFRNLADTTDKPIKILSYIEIGIGLYGFLMPLILWLAALIYPLIAHYMIIKTIFCMLIILTPTTLLGAIWPFVSRYYLKNDSNLGKKTGSIYSVNSLGSCVGAFAGGFIFVPLFGITATAFIASALSIIAGALLFFIKEETIK